MADETRSRAQFDATTSAPAQARRLVEEVLTDAASERAYDAKLLVSELVTNSLLHSLDDGKAPVEVRIERNGSEISGEVVNAGPEFKPRPPKLPASAARTGRGLWLVDALADSWGTGSEGDRHVVWFRLGLDDQARNGSRDT